MRSRRSIFAGVLAAFAALVGVGGSAYAATHSVSIMYPAFTPSSLTIKVGDKVTWTSKESGLYAPTHTVSSDDGHSFDSGDVTPGASYSFTFTKAGIFAYHCNYHSNMRGTIVVQGTATSSTPTPTPTHSRTTPKPSATATAQPAVPASPTPTRSVKPSPRATHTASARAPTSTPTSSRVVATGSTSSGSGAVVASIVAGVVLLLGAATFAVRRRTVR